jgi:hypothetical protein
VEEKFRVQIIRYARKAALHHTSCITPPTSKETPTLDLTDKTFMLCHPEKHEAITTFSVLS